MEDNKRRAKKKLILKGLNIFFPDKIFKKINPLHLSLYKY